VKEIPQVRESARLGLGMVELADLTEGLVEYQQAARGRPPEERLALWNSLYAARHQEFFSWYLKERCPQDRLAKRLPDYDPREHVLARPSQVLPGVLEEIWPRVLAACGEGESALRAILFAGGFDADGFCEHYGPDLAVFFQAEVICTYPEGLLRVHSAHESFHYLHAHKVLSRDPAFSYKERYFEIPVALFAEGLAVAVSRRVCPGQRTARYLLWEASDPVAADWCREHERELFGRVRRVLGHSDQETFRAFFSGGNLPDGVPHWRTGYYVGWRVVEQILQERTLPDVIRAVPSQWPDLVTGALDRLSVA